MKLGFMTACLPGADLEDMADWAVANGYSALEVAAWPGGGLDHIAAHRFDQREKERVERIIDHSRVEISAISYYTNMMAADPDRRGRQADHLRKVVETAAALDVGLVGVLVGRDVSQTVAENLALGERIWAPLVEHAHDHGVRFVVENSPMLGAHPDTYPTNLAYSPELWEWMFSLGLYLNYDPSHLLWLGADPYEALRCYQEQVLHVQAKDVEIDPGARTRFTHFGQVIDRTSDWDSGWWRYRIPGRGEVDFTRLLDLLDEAGFDGCVAVEHEDPVWSGSEERIYQGLVIAERTLGPGISRLHPTSTPKALNP